MLPLSGVAGLPANDPGKEEHAMIDWILPCTLLAIVLLHWLFEILPGKERNMWCSELSLEPVYVRTDRQPRC